MCTTASHPLSKRVVQPPRPPGLRLIQSRARVRKWPRATSSFHCTGPSLSYSRLMTDLIISLSPSVTALPLGLSNLVYYLSILHSQATRLLEKVLREHWFIIDMRTIRNAVDLDIRRESVTDNHHLGMKPATGDSTPASSIVI